jgi:hypothetical protein
MFAPHRRTDVLGSAVTPTNYQFGNARSSVKPDVLPILKSTAASI